MLPFGIVQPPCSSPLSYFAFSHIHYKELNSAAVELLILRLTRKLSLMRRVFLCHLFARYFVCLQSYSVFMGKIRKRLSKLVGNIEDNILLDRFMIACVWMDNITLPNIKCALVYKHLFPTL
jgi:hypothetical protein